MPDPTKEQKEVFEAVTALRALVTETHGKSEAEVKQISESIDKFLEEQEVKNEKYVQDIKSAETKNTEFQERIDALEVDLARRVDDTGIDYKEAPEYKALQVFARGGKDGLRDSYSTDEVKATLRTDVDSQGGYLVTGEMDSVITKLITEISGLRSVSRVRTMSKKTLEMPIRTGILEAFYEGEGEQNQEGISQYGSETLTAFRLSVTVPITMDLLMDASFNMESEIFADAAEAFAQKEGSLFINGTDVKQPEGILTNSTVVANARDSITSGTLEADDLLLMTGDLKTGYNPVYTLNRKTLAFLRTLKSTDGVFLWQPGMNGPVANTINGFPYVLSIDMPDIASDSLSVAFGDFQRGYTIIDRTGVSMIRDEVTSAGKAIIKFTIHRWNYGKVVVPEAIQLLKTLT